MGIETNPDVQSHAARILPEVNMMREMVNDKIRSLVFDVVFKDMQIGIDFEGAEIRKTTMCGEVVKAILKELEEGNDGNHEEIVDLTPDESEEEKDKEGNIITMLAIGDVNFPEFMYPMIRQCLAEFVENFKTLADPDPAIGILGCSYDLGAKGMPEARSTALKNFDRYYGFSGKTHQVKKKIVDQSAPNGLSIVDEEKALMDVLVQNSSLTPGGMHTITVLNIALNKLAEKKNLKKRYCYPDNSFGTWSAIMKGVTKNEPGKFNQIGTTQKDGLHLTPEKIHEFYDGHDVDGHDDTWYITPLGNPSGTAMTGEQLTRTCEAILDRNPKASIILDVVYVRTMETQDSQELMSGIIGNPRIMDRVIFIESLSKTDGITGLRAGIFFSANKELFDTAQNTNMTLFAGSGNHLSPLVMAFLDDPDGNKDAKKKELHRFWAQERKGLFNFLTKDGKYAHLFDDNQEHINLTQLNRPQGLYLDLKMREGVDKMQIYKETGCIGVETSMESGKYMRFAVGKITEPTYSKFA